MRKFVSGWWMAVLCLSVATPALGVDDHAQGEIENLKRRIEVLEREKAEPRPFALEIPGGSLKLSGLIEVEGSYQRTRGGGDTADLVLATAYLDTFARVTPNIAGHVSLLYEESETPLEIDEAVLHLSCPRELAGGHLFLDAGQRYLPFGEYRSRFVTDPLTLELGETRDTTVLLGWRGAAELSAGTFAGDFGRRGSWFVSARAEPREGVAFGASFLSDLAESDIGLVAANPLYRSEVPGAAAFFSLTRGAFSLEGEYVTAVDRFEADVVEAGAEESILTGARPRAWNIEVSWLPAERWELALKAEGAKDFLSDLTRYGAVVSRGLFAQTVLALEYLYGDAKGEGNDPTHSIKAQLALRF